jgi:hypothetical protein
MSKYVEDIEKQNEELQALLAESQKLNEHYSDLLGRQKSYSIALFMRVNGHLIGVPWTDDLQFRDSLEACKHLKRHWSSFRKDFKKRFEKDGFDFKYFCITGMLIVPYSPVKYTTQMSYGDQWVFEDKKEIEDTMKILKSIKKNN